MSEFSINFNAGDELVDLLNNKFAIYPENNDDGALLKEVLTFTMCWMAFEASFFKEGVDAQKLALFVNKECFNNFDDDNFYKYIRDRYYISHDAKNNVSNLLFRMVKITDDEFDSKNLDNLAKKSEAWLKKKLLLNLQDEECNYAGKNLACLAVIYRYRNNLFHGIKFMNKFELQLENIKQANRFLCSLIKNIPFKEITEPSV